MGEWIDEKMNQDDPNKAGGDMRAVLERAVVGPPRFPRPGDRLYKSA